MFRSIFIAFLLLFFVHSAHAQIIDLPETNPTPISTVNGTKWFYIGIWTDPTDIEGLGGLAKISSKYAQIYTKTVRTMRPDSTMTDSLRKFSTALPEQEIIKTGADAYWWWNQYIDTTLTKNNKKITVGDILTDLGLMGYAIEYSLPDSLQKQKKIIQR